MSAHFAGHIYIVGNSGTGKTWLAKNFAAGLAAQGINVIVYDPVRSKGWPDSAVKYCDPGPFLRAMPNFRSSAVFADECKTLFDFDYATASQLLYKKRHDGVLTFIIAQRAKMAPPNARNMVERVYSFKQQREDSQILSEQYNEGLAAARTLKRGEFLVANSFECHKFKLDFSGGLPPIPKPFRKLDN